MSILNTNLISEIDKSIPVQFDIYGLPNGGHPLLECFMKYVDKIKQSYNIGSWCLRALKDTLEQAAFKTCMEMQVHLTDYPHADMHIRQDSFNIYDDCIHCQRSQELEVEIPAIFPFPFYVSPIPPYHTDDFRANKKARTIGPGLYEY